MRGQQLALFSCAVSWVLTLVGCDDGGGGDVTSASSEPQVASRAGIVQAGNDDGPLVTESVACESFRSALLGSWERLDCPFNPSTLLPCPHFVQPLAASQCVMYTEAGLDACVAQFDEASSCSEVVLGACVMTAVVTELTPGCRDVDAGLDGGESSEDDDGGAGEAGVDSPDAASSRGVSSAVDTLATSSSGGAPATAVSTDPGSESEAGTLAPDASFTDAGFTGTPTSQVAPGSTGPDAG